jgi:hypothetical protein
MTLGTQSRDAGEERGGDLNSLNVLNLVFANPGP